MDREHEATPLDRIRGFILLAFVAYGPWHTALHSGARPELELGFSWLATMTGPGLLQFGWWILVALCLGTALLGSWVKARPKVSELLVFSPALMWALNTRQLDASSGVAIISMFMICLVLSWWIRRREFSQRFSTFVRFAPLTLGVSLLLGVLIPMFVPHPRIDPWTHFYPVYRYIGWVGEGTALSLSSVSLSLISLTLLQSERRKAWALLALFAAMTIITLNLHRISLIAVGVNLGVWVLFSFRHSKQKAAFGVSGVAIALALFLFSPGFAKKNNLPWAKSEEAQAIRSNRPAQGIDLVINTSGRGDLLRQFAPSIFDAPVVGHGTGYSRRELRRIEAGLLEPQNDYLRILVENGFLGLFLYLGAIVIALKSLMGETDRLQTGVLSITSLLTLMLTENIIVSLSYGYGQLLLIGLVCIAPSAKQAEK